MKELRIALIGGAGFMGKAHSLAYAHAGFLDGTRATVIREVLVDVNPVAAEKAARELGWNRSHSSWQEVVADPTIDIIDIVTPPHTHAAIAAAALDNGKHVFCEKPLTNNPDEAVQLADQAAASGLINQVGFNYRHTPMISHAKSLLENGKLGIPLQFRASYLADGGFWVPDFGWRNKRSTGGSGASGDLGSHVVDMALYLNGPISRVVALGRTYENAKDGEWSNSVDLATDHPDAGSVWLAEFANGAMGTFSASFYSAGRKNAIRMELDGTKGALQFDWNKNNEIQVAYAEDPVDESGFRTIIAPHSSLWYPIPGLGYGYVDGAAAQFSKFFASILGSVPASPNFADAAHVQQVVEAVSLSASTGTWVKIPTIGSTDSICVEAREEAIQ